MNMALWHVVVSWNTTETFVICFFVDKFSILGNVLPRIVNEHVFVKSYVVVGHEVVGTLQSYFQIIFI
jgi:hypothetical protein